MAPDPTLRSYSPIAAAGYPRTAPGTPSTGFDLHGFAPHPTYDGGRVATFDRSYLFDKIVRWSHTVGFGGNWFRMQIGAQLRVKAGSQSMASAMNMALARK